MQVTKRVTQQVTQQVNSSNRETVMKNLREQHPDWSEERAQKEAKGAAPRKDDYVYYI